MIPKTGSTFASHMQTPLISQDHVLTPPTQFPTLLTPQSLHLLRLAIFSAELTRMGFRLTVAARSCSTISAYSIVPSEGARWDEGGASAGAAVETVWRGLFELEHSVFLDEGWAKVACYVVH